LFIYEIVAITIGIQNVLLDLKKKMILVLKILPHPKLGRKHWKNVKLKVII